MSVSVPHGSRGWFELLIPNHEGETTVWGGVNYRGFLIKASRGGRRARDKIANPKTEIQNRRRAGSHLRLGTVKVSENTDAEIGRKGVIW